MSLEESAFFRYRGCGLQNHGIVVVVNPQGVYTGSAELSQPGISKEIRREPPLRPLPMDRNWAG